MKEETVQINYTSQKSEQKIFIHRYSTPLQCSQNYNCVGLLLTRFKFRIFTYNYKHQTIHQDPVIYFETIGKANLLEKERNHIHEQFEAIDDYLKQLSENIISAMQQQLFNTFCILIAMSVQAYQETQKPLQETMLDLQQGIIKPLFLIPLQLKGHHSIRSPSSPNIAIRGTSGDYTKCFPTKTFVIFQPIINSEKFQLFNLVPGSVSPGVVSHPTTYTVITYKSLKGSTVDQPTRTGQMYNHWKQNLVPSTSPTLQ